MMCVAFHRVLRCLGDDLLNGKRGRIYFTENKICPPFSMIQPESPLGQINQRRLPHLSLPPTLNLAHLLQGLIHSGLIRQ